MKIKNDNNKLWPDCLSLIQSSVSEQAFETWFSSISMVNCNGEAITLQVPNRFHYEWIESKYSEILSSAIEKVFGAPLKINYSVLIKQEEDGAEGGEGVEGEGRRGRKRRWEEAEVRCILYKGCLLYTSDAADE